MSLLTSLPLAKPEGGQKDLAGFYAIKGPGLPYGRKTAAAVLDSVVVVSLKRQE